MGLDRLSPAAQADVVACRRVDGDVVLGYWDELLRCVPMQLQRRIEQQLASVSAPCLAVFGHELSCDERQYVTNLVPDVQLEDWHDSGASRNDSESISTLSTVCAYVSSHIRRV